MSVPAVFHDTSMRMPSPVAVTVVVHDAVKGAEGHLSLYVVVISVVRESSILPNAHVPQNVDELQTQHFKVAYVAVPQSPNRGVWPDANTGSSVAPRPLNRRLAEGQSRPCDEHEFSR